MLEAIKKYITEHKSFVTYFLISVLVTVIDVIVSRISEIWFKEVSGSQWRRLTQVGGGWGGGGEEACTCLSCPSLAIKKTL